MIKIAIVDDHEMFRAGLRSILQSIDNVEVVFEAENGEVFLEKLNADLEIVLMDMDMPGMNGIQTMEAIHRSKSGVKVIFISQNKDPMLICNLMELGARGYLHKDSNQAELISAIFSIHENGYYFNDMVSQSMLVKLAKKDQINPTFNSGEQLSEREREVLQLICSERTTSEIGEALFISPKTVENHRSRIMDKTGARNIAGLVVYAIKNKLVDVG